MRRTTSSLCRVARRKRCWRRVKERTPGRSKPIGVLKSQKCRDEEPSFFLDSCPDASLVTLVTAPLAAQDVPFFLDIAPDSSLLVGAAPAKSTEPPPAALPEDTVSQQEVPLQDEGDDMPPPEPLAFRVIPSTESMAEAALEAAWMAPEEQEPEHESLDRFYRENEAKRAERKRPVQPRYYEGDKTSEQLSSALRTDDGYLTRLGSKIFCMVCFGTGHRAQHCPESRCWICFSTGHNVKHCPRAKEKCASCWRKGHGGDPSTACPFGTLKAAQRYREQWSHVRCAVCREPGHPMCDGTGKPFLGWWDDDEPAGPRQDETQKAHRFAAALRGAAGTWNAGRSNWDEHKWKQDSWKRSHDWKDWDRSDRKRHDGWKDSAGSPRHRPHNGYHRAGESQRHHHSVPSMRIRAAPSARSAQRAAEKLKRKLR